MNSRHALGRLIESVQSSNGWSDRDLGERALSMGLDIAKSNFSRLKNQPLHSIKGSLVAGIAKVLGVPEEQVAEVALESMGVRSSRSVGADLETAVRMESSLPKHDKDILLAVIEKMRAIEKERGGNVSTAPNKLAGESPAKSNVSSIGDYRREPIDEEFDTEEFREDDHSRDSEEELEFLERAEKMAAHRGDPNIKPDELPNEP